MYLKKKIEKINKQILLLFLMFCMVFSSIFMSKEIDADYQLHKVSDIPSGSTTQGSFKGNVRGTWYINGIDHNGGGWGNINTIWIPQWGYYKGNENLGLKITFSPAKSTLQSIDVKSNGEISWFDYNAADYTTTVTATFYKNVNLNNPSNVSGTATPIDTLADYAFLQYNTGDGYEEWFRQSGGNKAYELLGFPNKNKVYIAAYTDGHWCQNYSNPDACTYVGGPSVNGFSGGAIDTNLFKTTTLDGTEFLYMDGRSFYGNDGNGVPVSGAWTSLYDVKGLTTVTWYYRTTKKEGYTNMPYGEGNRPDPTVKQGFTFFGGNNKVPPKEEQTGTAKVRYIDQTDNNRVLSTKPTTGSFSGTPSETIVSKYTTKTTDLNAYKNQGYEVVTDPVTSTLKFTAGQDKTYDIILKHKITDVPESKTVTRTINYYKNNTSGGKLFDSKVQSQTFNRTNKKDEVTGTISYGTWSPANKDFAAVNNPTHDEWYTDDANVAKLTVTPTSSNTTVNIIYKQYQYAKVVYLDETKNNELLEESARMKGKQNANINYDATDRISLYEDLGYKLVRNEISTTKQFDNNSSVDQEFKVILKHTYTTVDKNTYEKDKCLNNACTKTQAEKGC